MKSLIAVITLCLVLANNVSADRYRKHEGGHNKHQSSSHHISKHGRHGIHKQKHYYYKKRPHRHGRHYAYYGRPHRHGHSYRYYDNYDGLIITSGLIGYLLGSSY